MSFRRIDAEQWPRRPHFELFDAYAHPWLDICTRVDATVPWKLCRNQDGPAFFAMSLHLALAAVNAVEELRMRVREKEIIVHDVVHAGATVLRADETFGFGFFEFTDDFSTFSAAVETEVARVARQSGELVDRCDDDLVHVSVVPWIHFTAVGHPRQRGPGESIPKIVLGRCSLEGRRWMLPVAISAHHGLVDGVHVARFFDLLSQACEEAAARLGALGA